MEGGNNQNACDVCGSNNGRCGKCGNMCGYGRNHMLRWILGIIIITWVFCIGMRFGQITSYLDQSGYYGHSYRAMPMMYGAQSSGWSGGNVMFTTEAVPATVTGVKSGSVQLINSN